jgi:hypothetical protein
MKSCKNCGKELIKRDNEFPYKFERRIFCNNQCWFGWKRKRHRVEIDIFCKKCGKKIEFRPDIKFAQFKRLKRCKDCFKKSPVPEKRIKKSIS